MNNYFIYEGKVPSLNEYIKIERRNKFEANLFKRKMQLAIGKYIKLYKLDKFDCPIYIEFHWYERNMKRDMDNVIFNKKFFLDAMVENGIIPNDNQKYVSDIRDKLFIDKDNPRVEVYITKKNN